MKNTIIIKNILIYVKSSPILKILEMNLTKDRKTTGIKIAPNNPMRIKEIFFTLWKYKNTPFVKKIKNKKTPL